MDVMHIGRAAQLLGVTPEHLRALERTGRIPLARRDANGRIYTDFDVAVLRSIGIGTRPQRLRSTTEVLGGRDE